DLDYVFVEESISSDEFRSSPLTQSEEEEEKENDGEEVMQEEEILEMDSEELDLEVKEEKRYARGFLWSGKNSNASNVSSSSSPAYPVEGKEILDAWNLGKTEQPESGGMTVAMSEECEPPLPDEVDFV